MAVGGKGRDPVASNEIPRRDGGHGRSGPARRFRAARAVHNRIMPLMQVNFVESNPVPVKAAMAAMGLLEEVYRLPMCGPTAASRDKIANVLVDEPARPSARELMFVAAGRSAEFM